MTRFYLSLRSDDELIRDPDAYSFSTAQEARDAAILTLHDLLTEHPDDHSFDRHQIEIADETGHAVTVVNVHDALPDRRMPCPQSARW